MEPVILIIEGVSKFQCEFAYLPVGSDKIIYYAILLVVFLFYFIYLILSIFYFCLFATRTSFFLLQTFIGHFVNMTCLSYLSQFLEEYVHSSLPRKSVVRLTDRPDMTLDVYRGRKTITRQQQQL